MRSFDSAIVQLQDQRKVWPFFMNLCSIYFPMFVFLSLILYWICGSSIRKYLLLALSIGIYALYQPAFSLLLLAMIGISFGFGRILETNKTKWFLILSVVISFLPLVMIKLLLFPGLAGGKMSFVIPLGLSYYSFKSVSYLIDVYKDKIKASRNIWDYALFVSFFPELVVGPIDRADNLLAQIQTFTSQKTSFEKIKMGLFIMLWGYFQKVVIADRIAVYVNKVFSDLEGYSGVIIVACMMLFALQLYADFAGCTNIARGVGMMFGFELPLNFRQPFFAKSVSEFWSRWHMSLTGWFRDYIYIPLGGSRKGTIRKYCNIMIVFILSGFWHGNSLTYLMWGAITGIFQVVGNMTCLARNKFWKKLGLAEGSRIFGICRMAGTYLLFCFTLIFFKANSVEQIGLIFERLFAGWNWWELLSSALYSFAYDVKTWYLLLFAIYLMWRVDLWEARNKDTIWVKLCGKPFLLQLCVAYVMIFAIVIFGAYGAGFHASDFIYQNF